MKITTVTQGEDYAVTIEAVIPSRILRLFALIDMTSPEVSRLNKLYESYTASNIEYVLNWNQYEYLRRKHAYEQARDHHLGYIQQAIEWCKVHDMPYDFVKIVARNGPSPEPIYPESGDVGAIND